MASLSTHVLDQTKGIPGRNIRIDLQRINGDERELLLTLVTNNDGRTDQPFLDQETAVSGEYELVFYAGDYYRDSTLPITGPAFLDKVVIRFGLDEKGGHYHVPLLLSPYGYSTYKGS